VYTYLQLYEMFFNLSNIKPYSTVVKLEDAYRYKHMKWWQSFYRQMFRHWLYPEFLTHEAQDLLVNPNHKGFADLRVKPISIGQKAPELVQELTWLWNSHDVTKRDSANQ